MKVLHVYRTYFPESQGGAEELIRQICRSTAACGVENRLFTLGNNHAADIIDFKECDVYRFHRALTIASCDISFRALSGFKELVEWADVVHYYFPWPFADLLHVLAAVEKPSVVTHLSDIVRQRLLLTLYRPLMTRFLNSVDAIVATSPNYLLSSDLLKHHRTKVTVIPIGLDENSFPQPDAAQLQSTQNRVGTDFFLFVGMLRYYKGLQFLVEALAGLDVRCVIAGSGPMEQQLKKMARKLGLDKLVFLGQVSDHEKMALLRLCRALVFPSHLRSESFGVTLLEAAMVGKPLISAEIGTGTTYVNVDGETGLVVAPANPAGLRDAMRRLQQDSELANRLGLGARARYQAMFSATRMGDAYKTLYNAVLS